MFDFLSVYDSMNDNYGLCVDFQKSDYPIHSTLKSFDIKCSTNYFNLVGVLMLVASVATYFVS